MKRFNRPTAVAGACVAMFFASGCATITRGSTQTWTVDSTPIGAAASLSNGERCETPCTLTLKRKYPLVVEICKPGFARVETNVQSSISGQGGTALAGNVLVGGLIGVGIDAGTGATKDLLPNPLKVALVAEEPGCTEPSFPRVPKSGQTPEHYATGKK